MAAERLTMRNTKEILRLHFGLGISGRKIVRSCNIARSTVADYIMRAKAAGIGWPLPDGMDDTALDAKLFVSQETKPSDKAIPHMEEIHKELRKKGVTLQLLWVEYKQNNPDGCQYSRFCELYSKWAAKRLTSV